MFDVKTEEGVVTGTVNGVYMDAAVVGETAGLEVSLDQMHAFDQGRSMRHARLQLTLDMTPEVMSQMLMLLAEKLNLPAFAEHEWRRIWSALETAGEFELSRTISEAYRWTS
jgi:hypothetical protein